MSVDVLKLLFLLLGTLNFGAPNSWDTAVQLRVSMALSGPTVVELAIDPVPIYYRPVWGLCGKHWNWTVVLVNPRAEEMGCRETLQHELNHVWQARAWGLAHVVSQALAPNLWEPSRPWEGADGMPAPRSLNWPLIRLWIPLEP